jgi:hypothetical protein
MNANNYTDKYLKYKTKYLQLKYIQQYGGNGPLDDILENIFGIKQEVKQEVKQDVKQEDLHDIHDISHIPRDAHDIHATIIKKHAEIESETEGFEHGSH